MQCERCGKTLNGNWHPAILIADHAVFGCRPRLCDLNPNQKKAEAK